jgi:hypothetical protein
MKWINTKDKLPEFGVPVLVNCKIYGRYIATLERIEPDCDYGNWHDGKILGVLPPTHWMELPPPPKGDRLEEEDLQF